MCRAVCLCACVLCAVLPGTVVARFNMKGIGLPTHLLAPYLKPKKKRRRERDVMSQSDWGDFDILDKIEALGVAWQSRPP